MADQNDLNKPDLVSNYSSEVLQTIRGHIARIWTGDYTGMGGLVANMRRWVDLGSGNAKLVKRNSDGSETTIFDSSDKPSKSYVDYAITAESDARNSAIDSLASVAKSGSYNDLGDKPKIPANLSDLVNDSQFSATKGEWAVKQDGSKLYFLYKDVKKASIDTSGNMKLAGDIYINATI